MPETKQLSSPGIADMLKEIITLYRRNFGLIFGVSLVVNLPLGLIGLLYALYPPRWWVLIFGAISMAASPILAGALVFAVAICHLGLQTSVKACYQRVMTKSVCLAMLGVSLVQGYIQAMCYWGIAWIVIAAMRQAGDKPTSWAAMAPVILFGMLVTSPLWVRFMLAGPVVVLEKKSVGSALVKSWSLIGRSTIKCTLVIIIANVLIFAGPMILQRLILPVTDPKLYYHAPLAIRITQQSTVIFFTLLFGPLVAIAETLIYFNIRNQNEAFELKLLARDLEQMDVSAQ